MERYERYKDSGVKWIGEIPEHWGMYKLKYLFKLNKNKNIGNKCNTILSLSYGKIKIKKDLNEGLTPESYESYQLLSTGDIVIRSTDLQNDHTSLRTGLVKIEGAITSAYIGLKNLDMSLCDSRFYHYFLHDWDITKAIYNQGKGLRQSLNWDDIKNMLMPVLDISEQTAIANYLDSVTSKIDEAISQQQKMIDLLNERKQIIIQNTVTKGLDPNAKMKDSGVEWIGEIPEDWDVYQLKHFCTYNNESLSEKTNKYLKIKYIEISDVNFENGVIRFEEYNFSNAPSRARRIARKGDIIISTVRTYLKSIASIDFDYIIVSTGFCVIRSKNINTKFLKYAVSSDSFMTNIIRNSVGASYPSISSNTLMGQKFPVPHLSEQKRIAGYLDDTTSHIDSSISQCEKMISLLQERKQIIINDVVTGKVKVI